MNQKTLSSSPGLSKGHPGRLSKTSPEIATAGKDRPHAMDNTRRSETPHLAWETQLGDNPGWGMGEGCFHGKDRLGDRTLTGGRQKEDKGRKLEIQSF